MVDVQPSALAGEVSEQGFSGQLGFCLDSEQPQASLMGALDEPFQQQQQGQEPLGELRSSSGECTSGESNTSADKSSRKESKHQGTSSEGLEHVRQGFTTEDGAGTPSQVEGGVEVEKNEQKEGEKAKLPRPVGPNKCPRCASDDTKFCYYNNYNIKQPRFFCKACQRYWTAGGSLRNVPVGAGKRKNKSAATREQEKAAAGAAKQAAASFEQFRSLLMDPTLAYSNANPRMALPGGFPVNPQMGPAGQLPMMMGFNPMESASLSGLSGQPMPNSMLPSQPQGSFGGAASSGVSEDGSFGGRRTRLRLDGSLDLALSGAMKAEGELLPEDQSDIKASGGYSSGFSAYQNLAADSNFGASTGTQPEWLNLAAAAAVGQQQAQMQHAQFQQAAALQQLQAAAAGWGQGQNMYGGLWPYNFYSNPYAVAYSGGAMPLMNAGAWNGMDGANGGTPVSGSTSTSLPSGAATSCGLSGGMSATMMPGGNPSNFWAGGNGAWPNGTSAAGIGPWSGWGVANQNMAANALMQQQQQMKQYSAAMGGFPGGQPAGSSMASGGSDNSAGTGANGLLPKDPSQLSYGPGN